MLLYLAQPPTTPAASAFDWHPVQTFSMLCMEPEEAAAKGWSVNGLWSGFGMWDAVRGALFLTSEYGKCNPEYRYATIEDYIKDCHAHGLLAPATLMGVAGHPAPRCRFPEMEKGACAAPDGSRGYWSEPDDSYFMCANNPIYNEVLLTQGKEALDAGADVICIDEIQGNEFCFIWDSQSGYCAHCIAGYRSYLEGSFSKEELQDKFGIEDVATLDFAARLGAEHKKPWMEADALYRELWRLQERLNFESRKVLVDGLRAHMAVTGRRVPISANVVSVGLGDINGWRMPGLKWAQLLDFLAFENDVRWILPRGKWVTYERLAHAAFPLPSVAVPFYNYIDAWGTEMAEGKVTRSTLLYAMLAEANANRTGMVNYFQKVWQPEHEPLWEDFFRCQRFILEHREIFGAPATTGADIAVLFIENEGQRFRTGSFVGMCQALAESNIPFDVITDGGDGFVPVELTAAQLQGYSLVIIPQALELAPQQKEAIQSYVKEGGYVLSPEAAEMRPEDVESSDEARYVVLPRVEAGDAGIKDLAEAYCLDYEDSVRGEIRDLVQKWVTPVLEVSPSERTFSVYPYYQAERLVLHLVNTDYDSASDEMRPKKDVQIRVKRPTAYEESGSGKLYTPEQAGNAAEEVAVRSDGAFLIVEVPVVDVYAVVVL